MIIKTIHTPFPHLIVKDFYDENELKLIWQELDFLTSPTKLVPANLDGSLQNSNALSTSLENIYKHLHYSNIFLINKKILAPEIIDAFFSLSEFFGHIKKINRNHIKLKYYENGHNYPKHIDGSNFTGINYLYREPKKFEGGDLYFDDYNYKVELTNNMFVLFMSSFYHRVSPIVLNENSYFTGHGKYSITNFLSIDENIS